MLEEQIRKIVELRHDAPYAILGPHFSERERALTIRAFLPQAKRAYVLPDDGSGQREMQKLHPDGLFAARLPGITTLKYRLIAVDANGQTTTFHDPYAIHEPSFTRADGQAFQQGALEHLFTRLGAHPWVKAGVKGVNFMLWAPHASRVSVVGTFNQWDGRRHPLERHESGVWELFIPGLGVGDLYKYEIRNAEGAVFLKTDPLAFQTEAYPKTAALICDLPHSREWGDDSWMTQAAAAPAWRWPVTIHHVTLDDQANGGPDRVADYGQLQDIVLPYLLERGCNHVELSFWAHGETVASYYAPNPRYGRPEALMAFIDACHQRDIGVILDWIPPLIPREGQELTWFDGTRIYDADVPERPDLLAFELGRLEVRNFLAANALFWRQVYHVDALRTDARTFAARLQGQQAATPLRFLLRETAIAPTLTATDSATLKQGRHSDPHALLGPHPLAGEPGLSVVRALLPEAESPCLLPTDQPHLLYPLQWVQDDELFEAIVVAEATALRYQLGVTEQGRARVFADPYAFKFSNLGDQDCYLFAEGNHYRIW